MKDSEFKALTLATKIKLRRLKKKLQEAEWAWNYYLRGDIKACIDALKYEQFNLSARERSKQPDLVYDYDY